MASSQDNPVAGVIWMLITGLCFIAVTAIVKYMGDALPAPVSAFLRYLMGLVFFIPMLGQLRAAKLTPRALKWFGFRGIVHSLAVMLWFYAMTQISIAEVTAMNYLAPIYVTIAAVFVLGEKLAMRRILAVVAAFIGAMVILRPGFREISSGHIAMMVTALLFAGSYMSAKIMADEVKPSLVVAMLSITVTIGLAPFAVVTWVTPSVDQLALIFLIAAIATVGHYTMTLAFRAAPMTVTQPVTFVQLVWAVLLGWLVFDEAVDIWVVLGGVIILASVSFITWREAMLKRAAVTPVTHETKV